MSFQRNRLSAKLYKYSKDGDYLTDTQREFYEDNGYVIVRNLVNSSILDECKERFIDLCNENGDTNGYMTLLKNASLKSKNVKGEFLINKIQDLAFDDIFFKYISCQSVVNIVRSIIGPNITAFHSMLINKPPDSDKDFSRHPVHQDLHYFPLQPAESLVASWTAMERVDEENGCLFVIPGSHTGPLMKHDYTSNVTNKLYHGVLNLADLPIVNLVMDKGDTVFFHPLLLHGSGPNLTKGFRKAISCHYADSNCEFVNVMGTDREGVAREVEEISKIKKWPPLTFCMYLKMKSRLISGTPGNFQKLDSHL